MCMDVFPQCAYLYHVHVWFPRRSEYDVECPQTRVMDGYKIPGWYWQPKQGPLQEEKELLTTRSSFMPQKPLYSNV